MTEVKHTYIHMTEVKHTYVHTYDRSLPEFLVNTISIVNITFESIVKIILCR
jgi:hypothetical protein